MRLIATLLLASVVACAQQDDMAAVARANKQQSPAPPAKVYTNDDLGYGNPGDSDKSSAREKELAKLPRDKQDKARQIVKQILAQREQVAKLQAHADKLQAIQTERDQLQTPPPLSVQECTAEPERCESRRAFLNDVTKTEKQLETAKKKLEELEDSAHKAGYPPSVFDP